MKCFVHGDEEARAICASCGRGLCHACCPKDGSFMHCSPDCLARLEVRHRVFAVVYRNQQSSNRALVGFMYFIALFFVGVAAFAAVRSIEPLHYGLPLAPRHVFITTLCAGVAIGFGLFGYRIQRIQNETLLAPAEAPASPTTPRASRA